MHNFQNIGKSKYSKTNKYSQIQYNTKAQNAKLKVTCSLLKFTKKLQMKNYNT